MYGDKVELSREWESDWSQSKVTYSNREYLHYEVLAARVEDPDYDRPRKAAVTLKLYVDCETSIVVYDVAEYEKSLGLEPEVREEY